MAPAAELLFFVASELPPSSSPETASFVVSLSAVDVPFELAHEDSDRSIVAEMIIAKIFFILVSSKISKCLL